MGFTLLCEQAISKEMSDIFMMFPAENETSILVNC